MTGRPAILSPFLLAAAALAGCQPAPKPTATAAQLRFEVTDLRDPAHPRAVPAAAGATLDFPLDFNIAVRTVGTDPAGVRTLDVATTSYTPACGEWLVPRIYRTKVIVLPNSVTAEAATPTSQSFNLPLSTLTLIGIALCEAPSPTLFHLQAHLLNANSAGAGAALTIRIGNVPPPPKTAGARPPPAARG